jgi:hypothetical protein
MSTISLQTTSPRSDCGASLDVWSPNTSSQRRSADGVWKDVFYDHYLTFSAVIPKRVPTYAHPTPQAHQRQCAVDEAIASIKNRISEMGYQISQFATIVQEPSGTRVSTYHLAQFKLFKQEGLPVTNDPEINRL